MTQVIQFHEFKKIRKDARDVPTEERRRYRRSKPVRPISIQLPDGTIQHNLVADVSVGGLRLRCDPQAVVVIHPDGETSFPERAPRVKLRMSFLVDGKEELVTVTCKYCYVRGTDTEVNEIGVQFEESEGKGLELFRQFVQESLLSAGSNGD